MKKDIHPTTYRAVVFQDLNDNSTIITRSTVATEESITLDGTEYPLVKVHISSSSHPFFTGEQKFLDVLGRVDKFVAKRQAASSYVKKDKKGQDEKTSKPKSLKEMLTVTKTGK